MEIGNRLTATRGKGVKGNGGKKVKGLVKEHVLLTHGHGQRGGMDCGSGVWDRMEDGNGEKIGTTVTEYTRTIFFFKKGNC